MNELVDIAGGTNVYADIEAPSKTISLEDVARRNPEFMLAGPIGADKIAGDPRWRIVRAVRDRKVLVVDTRCRRAAFRPVGRSRRVARKSPAPRGGALTRFRAWYWVALLAALIGIAMVGVARGAVSVSLGAVIDALRGVGDPTAVAIVRDLRLPRVILGALVGAGLGASGARSSGLASQPTRRAVSARRVGRCGGRSGHRIRARHQG